jgi:tripartite-type tricarboxylate transporter receptor subunit TctC
MKLSRRQILRMAMIAAASPMVSRTAQAQSYPTRPITMVVPYPAGGATDTLARILAARMEASLGQSVIIENIGGAGGSIGVGRVARSEPDGSMLCIGNIQTHVFNAATQSLQYDVVRDFAPVALIADTPLSIVARGNLPAENLERFKTWLAAGGARATCGIVGLGGPPHVAAILFQKQSGHDFQIVPYRGGAQLLQDLVGGQIDFAFGLATNYLGLVRSGQVKAYAILARKRWPRLPEIPTADEAGSSGLYASYWHALWVPKGTSEEIIAKLNTAVVDALADTNVRQRFADIGQDILPPDEQSPRALGAYQKAEIEKWWPIIKAAGIKSE